MTTEERTVTPSCRLLAEHQDDIYALQFRLERAVAEARQEVRCDATAGACLRRLGPLLQAAVALDRAISVPNEPKEEMPAQEAERSTAASDTSAEQLRDREGETTASYYRKRLPEVYNRLRADAVAAAMLLKKVRADDASSGRLPLTCVGQAPLLQQVPVPFPPGSAAAVLVFAAAPASSTATSNVSGGSPSYCTLPAPAVVTVEEKEEVAGELPMQPPKPQVPPPKPQAAVPAEKEEDGQKSVEDQVVNDIKNAIQQMKQGALNISEIMSQERPSLEATGALLATNVTKSQNNIRDIAKIHGVADGDSKSGSVPRIVRALPGGTLAWRTIVAPLWAIIKHALLLCFVLAITGTTLLLILSTGKPKRFRARRAAHQHSDASPMAPDVVSFAGGSGFAPNPAGQLQYPVSAIRHYQQPLDADPLSEERDEKKDDATLLIEEKEVVEPRTSFAETHKGEEHAAAHVEASQPAPSDEAAHQSVPVETPSVQQPHADAPMEEMDATPAGTPPLVREEHLQAAEPMLREAFAESEPQHQEEMADSYASPIPEPPSQGEEFVEAIREPASEERVEEDGEGVRDIAQREDLAPEHERQLSVEDTGQRPEQVSAQEDAIPAGVEQLRQEEVDTIRPDTVEEDPVLVEPVNGAPQAEEREMEVDNDRPEKQQETPAAAPLAESVATDEGAQPQRMVEEGNAPHINEYPPEVPNSIQPALEEAQGVSDSVEDPSVQGDL